MIRKSHDHWDSAVVLVRKKDWSTRFCIDLGRLNVKKVGNAYSLPRIDDTLDCLNKAKLFTAFDLKLGCWQVS